MAYITLDIQKLKKNYAYLEKLFSDNHIKWAVVSKLLCGNTTFLKELLKHNVTQICDSRVTNLKRIKSLNPTIETIYIKPPAKKSIKNIVRYADISLNTESSTIKLLDEEAKSQGKKHKIIIMIELGELREGILGKNLIAFCEKIFTLKHIEVVGIGTNLTCMNGVLPNHEKLLRLHTYKELIEKKFNKKIQYLSGGSSVTLPLIDINLLPLEINHFRVGEALFLGTSPYDNLPVKNMETDLFELNAEIIEITEKPYIPSGKLALNKEGESPAFDKNRIGKKSFRAIIDIGILDVDSNNLAFIDKTLSFVGGSSDMYVIDLGDNINDYKTGSLIKYTLNYMGILRILNSKYIDTKTI